MRVLISSLDDDDGAEEGVVVCKAKEREQKPLNNQWLDKPCAISIWLQVVHGRLQQFMVIRGSNPYSHRHKEVCFLEGPASNHLDNVSLKDNGNYVLLSNLHASVNKWEDAKRMRYRINKMPESSILEINSTMHEFLIGDNCTQIQKRYF
ncbi:hypothetical protein LguiB_014461 [Lonicera macranthoides]